MDGILNSLHARAFFLYLLHLSSFSITHTLLGSDYPSPFSCFSFMTLLLLLMGRFCPSPLSPSFPTDVANSLRFSLSKATHKTAIPSCSGRLRILFLCLFHFTLLRLKMTLICRNFIAFYYV